MSARRTATLFVLCLGCLGLAGCGHSPSFNVLGSYFPGWIAAIIVAILLTVLLRQFAHRTGLERHVPLLPLFYFSLAVLLACLLWLVSFE